MKSILVPIPAEDLEEIAIQRLLQDYRLLKDKTLPPMFSFNEKEEKRMQKQIQKAYLTLFDYYGVKLNDE